jgi:hypothetical protein
MILESIQTKKITIPSKNTNNRTKKETLQLKNAGIPTKSTQTDLIVKINSMKSMEYWVVTIPMKKIPFCSGHTINTTMPQMCQGKIKLSKKKKAIPKAAQSFKPN